MSTSAQPTPVPPTNPSTGEPAPSSPPAAAPTSPSPESWRAPATAPAWAAGKSPEEILGIAQQLEQTLSRVVQQPQTPQTPTPTAPSQPSIPQIGDDDYMNGATFRQVAPQYVQQYVQPQFQQMQASIAQTNLETVKRDPKLAPIFDKYGPEVYNKLASVDKSYWNVDNLRTIVNLVKADHVEEIAAEQASRLAAVQMETIRSSGAGFPSVQPQQPALTLQSEQLPADYRERLAQAKMTESQLDEFCRANDMTRADWFKLVEKTVVARG